MVERWQLPALIVATMAIGVAGGVVAYLTDTPLWASVATSFLLGAWWRTADQAERR